MGAVELTHGKGSDTGDRVSVFSIESNNAAFLFGDKEISAVQNMHGFNPVGDS